jgi:hypothetical protein
MEEFRTVIADNPDGSALLAPDLFSELKELEKPRPC